MKYIFIFILIISGVLKAQVATVIDSKSLILPRYTNLNGITDAISAPQHGMMVYNTSTATNWFYNGSTWVNLAMSTSSPTEAEGFGSWGCNNSALIAYQPVANINTSVSDLFGFSVSISGEYAIVGSPGDDEANLFGNGSATIYKRNVISGVWEFQVKLLDPSGEEGDQFGLSVAISGDYAVVSSPFDDYNGIVDNGSVSIFKRNSNTGLWNLESKILNSIGTNSAYFGYSISISSDFVVIGCYGDDTSGLTDNGSASIFKRNTNSGIWDFQTKIMNASPNSNDYFGFSVNISGDYVIVGAPFDDENGFLENGSSTIFKRNLTTSIWESQGKLLNPISASNDNFGASVSIYGDYALITAPKDDENGFIDNGSATFFKRNPSTGIWVSQAKLVSSLSANSDNFGISAKISGNYAIVGANRDDENGFTENGSTSIYRRIGDRWMLITKNTNPGGANYDEFGNAASIEESGRFIIGSKGFSETTGAAIFGKIK